MDKINIKANSKDFQVEALSTLESFAIKMGLNPKRCVAELNGNVVRADQFASTILAEGDKIEIMQIVAGG